MSTTSPSLKRIKLSINTMQKQAVTSDAAKRNKYTDNLIVFLVSSTLLSNMQILYYRGLSLNAIMRCRACNVTIICKRSHFYTGYIFRHILPPLSSSEVCKSM